MKRVTEIKLENFRAFYGIYQSIQLSRGENLLIYGENGSGKSSLFKALNDFLNSSRFPNIAFKSNSYSNNPNGSVEISFADFDDATYVEVLGTRQRLDFKNAASTNTVLFVQNAALAKGFLEYRNLLDVYLHKDPRPNLFELIVTRLLFNHIPVRTGGNYRLGIKWLELQRDLTNTYTRNGRRHKVAITELVSYERHLRDSLDQVFEVLNTMLTTYFTDLGINIGYTLQRLSFNYGNKWDWHTTSDLRLDINKHGMPITGDYSDVLNEARLSAFAVCLYLASIKLNPPVDLQVLYLDDIFIGMDTGNRLPILEILQNEFPRYQIFLSTYDRQWYELSKRFFEIHNRERWSSLELYVGKETANGIEIDIPTITIGKSEYERAIRFVHDKDNPDYPAAANYFRKHLEKLIKDFIPTSELADNESIQIADYKLSKNLDRTIAFFRKTGNDFSKLITIQTLLHGLIHPLSHYNINNQIYKNELLRIERALKELEIQLIAMDIPNNYRCILEPSKILKLTFCANQQQNHFFYYEISLNEPLVLNRNQAGMPIVCNAACVAESWYGHNGGIQYNPGRANKKRPEYHYISIENSYQTIHQFLSATNGAFPIANNYIQCCEWMGIAGWEPLSNLTVW